MKNKNLFLSICLIAVSAISFAQEQKATKLHVGTTTAASAASAALDITSTTKGFLIPRMTTAQRTAIATPAEGLEVYDTTTKTSWYYNGTAWVQDATGSASKFVDGTTATDAVYTGGNVGIGTTTPTALLHLNNGTANQNLLLDPANINSSGTDGLTLNAASGSGFIAARVAGDERMRILANGNVGIGTTTPTTKLDVAGSIKVGNDGDTATNGTIRYNSTTNKFQGYAAGAWVDLH